MALPRKPGRDHATTWALFALALLVRLLFWQATPDRAWPHSALYKGDAIVWADYAAALQGGGSFEGGLPLRPPGNAYLLAALGVDGRGGAGSAKLAWCLLGAFAVALFHRAARSAFGARVALAVGLWCALSTALMMLSTSLNNETPYLVLVAALLLLAPRLATEPGGARLVLWGALNALGCLVRVEHLLFFAAASGVLAWRWYRGEGSARGLRPLAGRLAGVVIAFCLVLLPWHVSAWRAIRAANHVTPVLDPAAESAQRVIEGAVAGIEWTPGARAELDGLPAYARRTAGNFVAATVLVRGGRRVEPGDLSILDEAFGWRPRPLPYPFVALYGPLNFYLANRPDAPPGFDPTGLDRPPTLAGGAELYPAVLIGGLPPPDLHLTYPPHAEAVVDGYRLGWRWIAAHPGAFLDRAAARVDVLWQGAALGWTGYGVPWGAGGVRRAVDLTLPEGRTFAIWRGLLAIACLVGVWRARASPALAFWLLFGASKLAAAALVFGYGRHGATLVPVVAALAVLGVSAVWGFAPTAGWSPAGHPRTRAGNRRSPKAGPPSTFGASLLAKTGFGRSWLPAVAVVVALLGLATEVIRWSDPPAIRVDGRVITRGDPYPADEHLDRRIEMR